MPYVRRPTYVLFKVASGGWSAFCAYLEVADVNHSIGTLVTPAYRGIPSLALVDLVVRTRNNTSAAGYNWFKSAAGGYIGLNPGTGTFSCGGIPEGAFYTPTNDWVFSEYRVKGLTNIASQVRPNTSYNVSIMHGTVDKDKLLCFNPYVEMSLYFNL